MPLYTEGQKAIAIEIASRHATELNASALAEIRLALNNPTLPKSTVWRWLHPDRATKKKVSTVSIAVQEKAAKALDQIFEDTARAYLAHAQKPDVVNKTSGQAAVLAAATAVDKMRLLRGLPTEVVEILPGLMSAIVARGLNPVVVFKSFYERLALPAEIVEQ